MYYWVQKQNKKCNKTYCVTLSVKPNPVFRLANISYQFNSYGMSTVIYLFSRY